MLYLFLFFFRKDDQIKRKQVDIAPCVTDINDQLEHAFSFLPDFRLLLDYYVFKSLKTQRLDKFLTSPSSSWDGDIGETCIPFETKSTPIERAIDWDSTWLCLDYRTPWVSTRIANKSESDDNMFVRRILPLSLLDVGINPTNFVACKDPC